MYGDRPNPQMGTERRGRRRHSLESLRQEPEARRLIEEASREPYNIAGGGEHAGFPREREGYGKAYGQDRVQAWQHAAEWKPYSEYKDAGYGSGPEYGSDSDQAGSSTSMSEAGYGRGYEWGEEDMGYNRGTDYGYATTGFGGRGFESGNEGRGHSRESDLDIERRYEPAFERSSDIDYRLMPGESEYTGEYIERSYDLRADAADYLGGWGEPLEDRPGYVTGRRFAGRSRRY